MAWLISGALILAALLFAWFSIRWQIGELFAEVASPNSTDAAEIAESAKWLAPGSPRGFWLSGAILKASFDEPTLERAISEYENAIRSSPNHYRAWTEYGRINEQAGRYERAETAFQKAIELAPEYTIPRWQAGNFYFRRGSLDKAIAELNAAAKYPSPYRIQVFSTAWNVLDKDPKQVERFMTDTGDSKATLARFYASVNRPDDALRVWNLIEPERRSEYGWQMSSIAEVLLAQRAYRGALEFSRQAGIDPDARPETVTNGDFEQPIKGYDRQLRFDWSLVRIDGKVDVSIDNSVARSGKRSLRFSVRGYSKPPFGSLRQAFAVTPGGRYRLTFWLRTEDLRSGSLPFIEIRNAKDDSLAAGSLAFDSGTKDWREMQVDFIAQNGDGVYLISGREPCAEECPMNGLFWIDDFSLVRLN